MKKLFFLLTLSNIVCAFQQTLMAETLYIPYTPNQVGQPFEIWTYNLATFPNVTSKIKLPIKLESSPDTIHLFTSNQEGDIVGKVNLILSNFVGFNKHAPESTMKLFELRKSNNQIFKMAEAVKFYRNQLYVMDRGEKSIWIFDNPLQRSEQKILAKQELKLETASDCPAGNDLMTDIAFDDQNHIYASWYQYQGQLVDHCIARYHLGESKPETSYRLRPEYELMKLFVDKNSSGENKIYAIVRTRNLNEKFSIIELISGSYPRIIQLKNDKQWLSHLTFDSKYNTYTIGYNYTNQAWKILKYNGHLPENEDPVSSIANATGMRELLITP